MTSHYMKCGLFRLASDVRSTWSSPLHLSSLPVLSCKNISLGWHPCHGHSRWLSSFSVEDNSDRIISCMNVHYFDSSRQLRSKQQTISSKFLNTSNYFCRHGFTNFKTQKVNVISARAFHGLAFNSTSVNLHRLPLCQSNHSSVRQSSSDHTLRFGIIDNQSPVVEFCRDLFLNFHEFTGLPIWASICLFGVLVKVLVMPLTVIGVKNSVKVTYVMASANKAQAEALKFTAEKAELHNWTEKKQKFEARRLSAEFQKDLYRKHKCSKAVNLVVHMNTALLLLYGLRGMRSLCPQFENIEPHQFNEDMFIQGVLWFSDLTVSDFILPLICWTVIMVDVEMRYAGYYMSGIKLGWREYLPKSLSLLTIAIGCMQPCCVPLLWTAMYSTQLLLTCLIRCPSVFNVVVRPSFIPALPSDATPNRDLLRAVKERYTFKKKATETDNTQSQGKPEY